MQTLHKDEKMQSDWVNVEYGSAYGSDDEDSYYPSGSGSGDGRGYNIPKNSKWKIHPYIALTFSVMM